jgi:hypothetical protein
MAVCRVIGIAIAALGLPADSATAAVARLALALLTGLGFLVPAFRDVHEPTVVDREGYFGFVAGLLRSTRDEKRPSRRSG